MSVALLGLEAAEDHSKEYGFVVHHQKLFFEIDFPTQTLTGRTEITILPQHRSLEYIRIDARQCNIPQGKITVDGVAVRQHKYEDHLDLLNNRDYIEWGVEQHEQQRERFKVLMEEERADGALIIPLPASVRIEEIDPMSESETAANAASRFMGGSVARHSSAAIDAGSARANTPILTPRLAVDQSSRYKALIINIPFSVKKFREGVHFAGMVEGDTQYPHVYSRHSMDPGTACSIFPCIDDPAMRCTWDIVVTCSRTLGDAMKRRPRKDKTKKKSHANGVVNTLVNGDVPEDDEFPLSEEDKRLEMIIKCSGELMHEVDDPDDSSKKVATFSCDQIVAAKHIGFGIGPFELVELSDYREEHEGEKIGQGQSSPVYAYCLPGRSAEVRHVCLPMAHALDWFMLTFGSYPFPDYCILFVDGQINDSEHTAGLSICTDRLLFPPDIIDPEPESVRTLVHALASQWIGVSVVAERNVDRWLIVGISHYMAGLFMKELCGENEYMFRQKQLCDELVVQDVERPSLHQLGNIIHLGRFEMDFMKLKAPLVLFILDRRLFKFTSRTAGLVRIISKLITSANINPLTESAISTASFRRQCEKLTRYRQTESFWNQWVLGAGCPRMKITHRFNKKRLQIELTITQLPPATSVGQKLQKESFLREVKEEVHGVYAGELRPYFTGSMTVRIHEADGSPYDHVVEIKTANDIIQIPYVTKYKRVRRANLKKDRAAAAAQGEVNGEVNEETVLYSLGDNIQSEEEMAEWNMQDWDPELKKTMEQENYEWIRIDADFEWLCAKEINMTSYMFVSQLQQDQNVEAQQESLLYFATQPPHPVAAAVLTRTLMDTRYFHGIRTMAAGLLKSHSKSPDWTGLKHLQKATSELFCYPGTMMPRSNDFGDRRSYYVELAIPHAMSNIRDSQGNCPKEARNFIMDQLRFNDNTDNEYSDVYKISSLLRALTNSMIPQQGIVNVLAGDVEEDDEPATFRAKATEELDRHRRMDEWINSYQNILTTTVLECKMRLMKAKVIPTDRNEFLRYLIEGNLEQVRIKAFEALIELGFLNNPGVFKFLICCLSTDSSPFVRNRLFEVFVLGLANIAIGENTPKPVKAEPEGGLQVEHDIEINSPEMQALIVRTTTIDGAMAALKDTMKNNEIWKEALWNALCSDMLSFSEHLDLLDMCSILFEAIEKLVVKIPLPRFWTAEKVGKVCMLLEAYLDLLLLIDNRQSFNSSKMVLCAKSLTSLSWYCHLLHQRCLFQRPRLCLVVLCYLRPCRWQLPSQPQCEQTLAV